MFLKISSTIPKVTQGIIHEVTFVLILYHILLVGMVYTYLAEGVCRKVSEQGGTFRVLARGYNHWASGRMEKLQINTKPPEYCHMKCSMQPSMKVGTYNVYLLLRCGDVGNVCAATCECAAGYVG